VARLAPGARVVKAFNTTGAENMANARDFAAKPMMPVAGDDAAAKDAVRTLAEGLGFEAVDAGPLAMSRQLEPLAVLWIKLAYAQGFGRSFAFAMTRR
jgi:predicted dinucleotide-binding enzyme